MPKDETFDTTFAALRGILKRHGKRMFVQVDEPGDYRLCTRTPKNRTGRPDFVAAVQIRKRYVSYHLMPVYVAPTLLKGISPALRTRMQGKSCFNFRTIEPAQLRELSALTARGLRAFRRVELPWSPKK
jgi:hypothetical protein